MTSIIEDSRGRMALRFNLIADGSLRKSCCHVLDNSLFRRGYGSSVDTPHKHHAYMGGLVVHTAEVVDLVCSMSEAFGASVDLDVLITAAVWHDYAKIFDYDTEGHRTKYGDRIGHVAGSYLHFNVYGMAHLDTLSGKPQEICHCILAHHGRKEWGAPVEPQTREAAILHYADMLSMQYGAGR